MLGKDQSKIDGEQGLLGHVFVTNDVWHSLRTKVRVLHSSEELVRQSVVPDSINSFESQWVALELSRAYFAWVLGLRKLSWLSLVHVWLPTSLVHHRLLFTCDVNYDTRRQRPSV